MAITPHSTNCGYIDEAPLPDIAGMDASAARPQSMRNRDAAPPSRAPYTVDYAYDHKGRMVRKIVSRGGAEAQRIEYLWDGWNIIQETTTDLSTFQPFNLSTCYYIWGLDLDGTLQGAGGVGGLLAVFRSNSNSNSNSNSSLYFPTYDANGNVSEYVSTNGEIVAHYDYSPFGEILVQSGDMASAFTHRFSTKPYCQITKLVEYQMRKYKPEIGRDISCRRRDEKPRDALDFENFCAQNFSYGGIVLATTFFSTSIITEQFNRTGNCVNGLIVQQADVHTIYRIEKTHDLFERTRIHEQFHIDHAMASILAIDTTIYEVDPSKYVSPKCLKAKFNYVIAFRNFVVAKYNFDQAVFDCLEYGGKCSSIQQFIKEMAEQASLLADMQAKYMGACAE